MDVAIFDLVLSKLMSLAYLNFVYLNIIHTYTPNFPPESESVVVLTGADDRIKTAVTLAKNYGNKPVFISGVAKTTNKEALTELRRLHGESADRNPYCLGLYNGIESALALLENREPEFRMPPSLWGDTAQCAEDHAKGT